VVIGAALATAGTLGYTKYKERDLKAKASSGALIYNAYGVQMRACRIYNTARREFVVRIVATKPANFRLLPSTKLGVSSFVAQNRSDFYSTSPASFSWWGNVVAAASTSVPINGYYKAFIGGYAPVAESPKIAIGLTPDC